MGIRTLASSGIRHLDTSNAKKVEKIPLEMKIKDHLELLANATTA